MPSRICPVAAQILEDLNSFAVHTPITAAAVYGGVGMGLRSFSPVSSLTIVL